MEEYRLDIEGLAIAAHVSRGRGGPALLCLHANSQDSFSFTGQQGSALGERLRVVCIDLPGHGASSRAEDPDRVYAMSGYVRVVQHAMRQLEMGPTLLIGHSLGGHILIQAAPQLPDIVGLMVLGTPPLRLPLNVGEAFLPNPLSALIFRESLTVDEEWAWARAQMVHPVPATLARLQQAMHQTDPRCRSHLGKNSFRGDFQDECVIVQQLAVPVAIILGDQDPFVNRAYCDALPLPNLWGGGVRILPGCGHSPHPEQPERFNALLESFIASCGHG
ncbi:MAG: alpha/beta hydrolase [Magnetococcus sp. MYC-9]